jgi:hypothetical protein
MAVRTFQVAIPTDQQPQRFPLRWSNASSLPASLNGIVLHAQDHDAEAGDADVPEVVAQSNGEVSAIPEKPNEPEPSQPSSAER